MLRIRNRQWDALTELKKDQFIERTVAYLNKHLPKRTAAIPPDELRAMVRQGLDRAADYGIEIEWDVCRFNEYQVIYGAKFDQRCDWAVEILHAEGLTGTERADALQYHHRNVAKGKA